MPSKQPTRKNTKKTSKQQSPKPSAKNLIQQQNHPAAIIQRTRLDPSLLTTDEVRHLQRALGNQAVGRLLTPRAQRQPTKNEGARTRLPEEAWHNIVRQQQGQVKPDAALGKTQINDDSELKRESDVMGAKAFQYMTNQQVGMRKGQVLGGSIQRYSKTGMASTKSIQEYIVEFMLDFMPNFTTTGFQNKLDEPETEERDETKGDGKKKKAFFSFGKKKTKRREEPKPIVGTEEKIQRRFDKIIKMVNRQLVKEGAPELMGILSHDEDPSNRASFSITFWTMSINSLHLMEDADLPLLANAAYHEARHAEQAFRVARKMAEEGNDASQIRAEIHIDLMRRGVVEAAIEEAMNKELSPEERDEAIGWQEDYASEDNKTKLFNDAKAEMLTRMRVFDQMLQTLKAKDEHKDKSDQEIKFMLLRAIFTPLIKAFKIYGSSPVEEDAWALGGRIQKMLGGDPLTLKSELTKVASVETFEKILGDREVAEMLFQELESILEDTQQTSEPQANFSSADTEENISSSDEERNKCIMGGNAHQVVKVLYNGETFDVFHVPDNGNCFFSCCAVFGLGDDPTALRTELSQSNHIPEERQATLAQDNEYVDENDIDAMGQLHNVKIFLYYTQYGYEETQVFKQEKGGDGTEGTMHILFQADSNGDGHISLMIE